VIRLERAPDDAALAALSEEFADIITRGTIERVEAHAVEVADGDAPDLPRIAFWFDRHGWSKLRLLLDRLNELA
jgi:hypothetical protein